MPIMTHSDVIYAPTDVSARWLVERNINQTVTMKLRPRMGINTIDGYLLKNSFSVGATPFDVTVRSVDSSRSILIVDYIPSGQTYTYYVLSYELTHIIPSETQLISASVDVITSAYTDGNGQTISGRLHVSNSINGGTNKSIETPSYIFNPLGDSYTFDITPFTSGYINSLNGYLYVEFRAWIVNEDPLSLTINPITIQYRW